MENLKNKKIRHYLYFNAINLPLPNEKLVSKYLRKFDQLTTKTKLSNEMVEESINSVDTEKILDNLFSKNFGDDNANQLYLQCIALNHIYSVSVKHLMDVAKHIYNNKSIIKNAIENGDYAIVDKVKEVKVVNNDGSITPINYLSFFSKFLRRYRPDVFPIYDSVVKQYLLNYFDFSPNSTEEDKNKFLNAENLDSYPIYIDAINTFIKHESYLNNIISKSNYSPYVIVDRFIWQYGKDAQEIIYNYSLLKKLSNLKVRTKKEQKKFDSLIKKYDLNIPLQTYIENLTKGE